MMVVQVKQSMFPSDLANSIFNNPKVSAGNSLRIYIMKNIIGSMSVGVVAYRRRVGSREQQRGSLASETTWTLVVSNRILTQIMLLDEKNSFSD
jgi:hypothetical protein